MTPGAIEMLSGLGEARTSRASGSNTIRAATMNTNNVPHGMACSRIKCTPHNSNAKTANSDAVIGALSARLRNKYCSRQYRCCTPAAASAASSAARCASGGRSPFCNPERISDTWPPASSVASCFDSDTRPERRASVTTKGKLKPKTPSPTAAMLGSSHTRYTNGSDVCTSVTNTSVCN